MATDKPTNDTSRTPKGNAANRPRREKDNPAPQRDKPEKPGNEVENPDWWRGDPGKRGEVL